MTTFASNRLRATVTATALALGLAVVAVFVVDQVDATPIQSASASVLPIAATADTGGAAAAASVAPLAAAGTEVAVVGSAPAADAALPDVATPAADDPLAGVIVEPVDPAEALFGDHAAVAVSN